MVGERENWSQRIMNGDFPWYNSVLHSYSFISFVHFMITYLLYTYNFVLFYMFFSQFSHSVMSNSLQPHGLQHTRPSRPSPTPRVYANSCPLSWWFHPTISSTVIPFSSCLQSFPASRSFPISQFFKSGCQSIGASASVLPMNIHSQRIIALQYCVVSCYISTRISQRYTYVPLPLELFHLPLL